MHCFLQLLSRVGLKFKEIVKLWTMSIKIPLTLYHTIPTFHEPEKYRILKTLGNKSGKLSQDTPVLTEVVKLGHEPDKIQV